jgi:inosine-uridine preferring nucleoside hydrolase
MTPRAAAFSVLLCSVLLATGVPSQQGSAALFNGRDLTAWKAPAQARIRVLLDTDANNELDDQHAIAYMLFNGRVFDVDGITVNRTRGGGDIRQHYAEAERVIRLANLHGRLPLHLGASGSFQDIEGHLARPDYDGSAAVRFIIERAHAADRPPLVLLPVGKLTNIALALKKDPSIAGKVRVVWLGSNYPEPGEYNLENDPESLRYILERTDVPFEIVTVRWGKPSGTAAVRATRQEIRAKMPGKGPRVSPAVTGRDGGTYETFGDYSVALFERIDLNGNPPARALFDMAAVAIVKNPAWASARRMPAPKLEATGWVDRPGNARTVIVWENFDTAAIMRDFYASMERFELVK